MTWHIKATSFVTLQFINHGPAIGANLLNVWRRTSVLSKYRIAFSNVLLKPYCQLRLLLFANKEWLNLAKKFSSISARLAPRIATGMFGVFVVSGSVPGEGSAELVIEGSNGREVRHAENDFQLLPVIGFRPSLARDNMKFIYSDASFSIKQTGDVSQFHKDLLSDCWDGGEFGESPMPGSEERGRVTPSQAWMKIQGVCNEHVPPAKAKICSVLHGNMQSVAEMTTPLEMLVYSISGSNKQDQRFSDWDILNIAQSDVISSAEYNWKQIAIHVVASGRELLINSGDSRLMDLAGSRIKNALRTFNNNFSSDLYSSGSLNNQIGGLQALVADATGSVVGGIDPAVWTFWERQTSDVSVIGGTMSATTIENNYMLPLWLKLDRGPSDCTDLIVMDSVYYTYWEGSQTSLKRYTDQSKADGGFVTMKYKNADVIYDGGSGIPTSRAYFINTEYLELVVHEKCDLEIAEEMRPVNQDGSVTPILWMGNLVSSNRFQQGLIQP